MFHMECKKKEVSKGEPLVMLEMKRGDRRHLIYK